MAKWQGKSLKKASGGRKWASRKKRKYELGRESADTEIGQKEKAELSVRGSSKKSKLLSVDSANITDPETGKSSKAEIRSVFENPADPHLARRNIITKGAIVETGVGRARVTSRPGQEGALNAILLEGDLEEKVEEEKVEKEEEEAAPEGKETSEEEEKEEALKEEPEEEEKGSQESGEAEESKSPESGESS